MTKPLVVIDADVLGRRRTGDETYVEQLLHALPHVSDDLRFAAITRRPDLVPAGVEPLHLPARSQELRMAWSVPRMTGLWFVASQILNAGLNSNHSARMKRAGMGSPPVIALT